MELKDRFLKYVSFDTQSDENSETFPSTRKAARAAQLSGRRVRTLGMTEVTCRTKTRIRMGTIPATPGLETAPVIGFISHVDTSPDMSGKDVHPHIIEDYDGAT